MIWRAAVLVSVLAITFGCGDEAPPTPGPEEQALRTLEQEASAAVREQVLRTCDKWKRLDGAPCVDDDVRRDQLACWLEKGLPRLRAFLKQKVRPRARDRGVMRAHNLCMEKRAWRFVEFSGYF